MNEKEKGGHIAPTNNTKNNNTDKLDNTPFPLDSQYFTPDFSYLESDTKTSISFESEEEEQAYFKAVHEKGKKISYNIVSLDEVLQIQLPPKKYILYPIMQQKGLVMLFADRGIGKTFASLNIAYAVASGGSFFNWHAEKASKVLYIDGEMPFHSIQERLAQIVVGSNKAVPNDYLNVLTPDLQGDDVFMPNLATKAGQEAIEPHLEGVQLIVLDNLATLCRHGRANEEESFLPV